MKPSLFISLLLLVTGFTSTGYVTAQSPTNPVSISQDTCVDTQNEDKYWHYRFRLYGNNSPTYPGFMRPGTGMGENLPFNALMPATNCFTDYILNVRHCNVADSLGPMGNIQINDATTDLGYLIAVLATEYALLSQTDQSTDSVVHELWLALKAFDRLDAGAEEWYPGANRVLDGFFLRDDVPGDFPTDPVTGDFRIPHPDPEVPGYSCVSSAWSCGANDVDDGTFCSQDQMIYLLTGFALVDKFVPSSESYNGQFLRVMARQAVHRMVKHLRDHEWTIRAPDGTTPPAQYGGSATTFSFKFAETADLLTENQYFGPTYQDEFSEGQGASLWFLAEEFFETQPVINRAMILTLASITHNWDAEEHAEKSISSDMEIFALMQSVLYEEEMGDVRLRFTLQKFIDAAPYGGPCHNYPGCKNVNGWRTANRWLHPNHRNGNPNLGPAAFNGLDFMLLYNLFELYKIQQEIEDEPCPEEEPKPVYATEISVFPVPFKEKLTVQFLQEEKIRGKVEITDVLGKVAFKEILDLEADESVSMEIPTDEFSPGMYWVSVTRGIGVEHFRVLKH